MTEKEVRERARQYTITIDHDSENSTWNVEVPAFPLIFTYGASPEAALANAYEAIECVLAVRAMDGRPLPEPDTQVPA